MIDIPLLITVIVVFGVVVACSLVLLAVYSHEDDKNQAKFPRLVVILSLATAAFNVLMLPLDIANHEIGGGLDAVLMWNIIYWIIGVLVIILIPFALFYYESETPLEDKTESQFYSALKWTVGFLFAFALTLILLFVFLGKSDVPVKVLKSSVFDAADAVRVTCTGCSETEVNIELTVDLTTYVTALLALGGWIIFIMFGGIGLVSLPQDWISDFRNRPDAIELQEFADQKIKIAERASNLIAMGETMQKEAREAGKSRPPRKAYNKYRSSVYLLEEDFNRLMVSYKERGGSPLGFFFKLVGGILGGVISMMWVLHIVLFVLPGFNGKPVSPFLNTMFIELDSVFGLFGTAMYAVFIGWLLVCVVRGNLKFGLRFLMIFPIHPMRKGKTLMNSFLFNCLLMLISSAAIVQFATIAFSQYSRLTAAETIFGLQVLNLKGLRPIWEAYPYALLVMVLITFIYGVFRRDPQIA